ncbi:MAG TPA: collagen-binding domain-containing protein [Candidatus Limnocylindria bacterium]|nr:collagen-binding domain-containing protein [Candidatus Limnocylindria bacterium]
MNTKTKLAVMMALATAGALGAQAQSYLSLYNVIVKNNLALTSDVEGKVVTKNYTDGNSATLAKNISVANGVDTVYISGNIVNTGSNLTVQDGSLALGPNANLNGRSVTFNGGQGAGIHTGSTFDFGAVFNGISTESTKYAAPSNFAGSVTASASTSGNNLNFSIPSNADGKALFFTVAASSLGVQNQSINLVNPNGVTPSSIIINVTGSTSFTEAAGVNFGGLFSSTSNTDPWLTKTLWNFNGFTSLSINGWRGSLMAPSASVSNTGSVIYGSVAATDLTGQGEIHLPTWSGVSAVPEPSTYAAGAAVAGMIGFGWYRTRKQKA